MSGDDADFAELIAAHQRNQDQFRDAILAQIRADMSPRRLLSVEEELVRALDRLLPAIFTSLGSGENLEAEELLALRQLSEVWARKGVSLRTIAEVALAAGAAAREMTWKLSDGSHLAVMVSFGQGVRIAQEAMTALALGHARGVLARHEHRRSRAEPVAATQVIEFPEVHQPATPAAGEPARSSLPPATPTSRASDILRLVAEGRTNAHIAETLNVSAAAVNYHVGRLMRVVRASNRTALVARAYENGWLPSSVRRVDAAPPVDPSEGMAG